MRKTKHSLALTLAVGLVAAALPATGAAADCPQELTDAKSALSQALASAQAAAKESPASRQNMPDVKAPRQNMPDVKAPQSVQDSPMPRQNMPDVKAPRQNMPDVKAPRIKQARALIRQSERACQRGHMALSAKKAQEALALLK